VFTNVSEGLYDEILLSLADFHQLFFPQIVSPRQNTLTVQLLVNLARQLGDIFVGDRGSSEARRGVQLRLSVHS